MTGCSNDLGGAKRSNEGVTAEDLRTIILHRGHRGAESTEGRPLRAEADSLGMTPRRGGAGEHGRALLGFTTHALPIIRGPLRSADRLLVRNSGSLQSHPKARTNLGWDQLAQ
jgi:hypothetical protein